MHHLKRDSGNFEIESQTTFTLFYSWDSFANTAQVFKDFRTFRYLLNWSVSMKLWKVQCKIVPYTLLPILLPETSSVALFGACVICLRNRMKQYSTRRNNQIESKCGAKYFLLRQRRADASKIIKLVCIGWVRKIFHWMARKLSNRHLTWKVLLTKLFELSVDLNACSSFKWKMISFKSVLYEVIRS